MCLYNKPKKECPICLQEKKLTTKCKICTDTMICQDCCLNLCEKGLCGKCPVCRQPNWKQPKKTQILPKIMLKFKPAQKEEKESPEVFPQIDREEEIQACCDTWYKIKMIIFTIIYTFAACMIVYVLGMFTVFIFTSGDGYKNVTTGIALAFRNGISVRNPVSCRYDQKNPKKVKGWEL